MGMLPPLIQQILADTTDYNAKLTEVQAKGEETAESSEASAEETGNAWAKAGLVVGAAVVAIGAVAVDLAMKYQSATANLAANADISSAAATKIGNAFLGQAFTTTFSAQQTMTAYAAVAGQMDLVAGHALTAQQALTFMKTAQDLAEASGTSLASATSDLSKTMQAFGIPLSGATAATNDLFNAARDTGQSVDTFSASIDKARASMGAAAPPLSALSGLVVDLAAHGETGRQAMSALNSAFTGIITPTAAVTAAQQAMGVSFINAKTGGLDPLSQIFTELQPKLAGMSAAQADATLKSLGFGSASSKLAETIQAGPAVLAAYTAQVGAAGSAHVAAAKNADTMEGSVKTLESGVEDLLTQLGQILIPVLKNVVTAVDNVVTFFDKNHTAALVLAVVIGGLVTLLTAFAVVTAASAVGTAAVTVATAAWSVATGIAAAATGVASVAVGVFNAIMDANPIAIVVLAIVALIAIIVLLVTHFTQVADVAKTVWNAISGAVGDAVGAIVGFVSGMISKVVGFFTALPGNLLNAIAGLYNTVGGFLSGVWNTITSDVSKFIGGIVNFFIDLPGKIAGAIGSMVSAVLAKVKSAANSIPVIGGALSAIGLATGGIVTKPTLALLGETETEYVLPESQLKSGRASVQSLAALSGQAPVRSLATTGGSGGGGGVTIGQLSIPVTVPPGTTPQMAQSVGTAVQNAVQTAMAQVVRQLSAGVYHP
jgi:TP901 family phage tail tape measure protein